MDGLLTRRMDTEQGSRLDMWMDGWLEGSIQNKVAG